MSNCQYASIGSDNSLAENMRNSSETTSISFFSLSLGLIDSVYGLVQVDAGISNPQNIM